MAKHIFANFILLMRSTCYSPRGPRVAFKGDRPVVMYLRDGVVDLNWLQSPLTGKTKTSLAKMLWYFLTKASPPRKFFVFLFVLPDSMGVNPSEYTDLYLMRPEGS